MLSSPLNGQFCHTLYNPGIEKVSFHGYFSRSSGVAYAMYHVFEKYHLISEQDLFCACVPI